MFKTTAPSYNKYWLLPAIICVLFTLTGCNDSNSAAHSLPPTKVAKVHVVEIQPERMEDYLTFLGTTEPETDVCVSSESAGTVVWIGVKEGDRVEEKSVIARLDTASSGARFDKAKAAKQLAAEKVRRREELLKKGVLAQEEFDRIRTELARSDASLKEMRVGVRNGIVRAPIDGIVNARHIDKGERVTEGSSIVEIVDLSKIRVTVNVSETNIPYINKDSRVNVRLDAVPNRVWEGNVEFVSLKADEKAKTFKVKILIDNPDGTIRAGMLARVRLQKQAIENAILIPLDSIISQGGERLVYVEAAGIASMRIVRTGAIVDHRVQIVSGLNPGENLVVSGHTMIEDGMEVVLQ